MENQPIEDRSANRFKTRQQPGVFSPRVLQGAAVFVDALREEPNLLLHPKAAFMREFLLEITAQQECNFHIPKHTGTVKLLGGLPDVVMRCNLLPLLSPMDIENLAQTCKSVRSAVSRHRGIRFAYSRYWEPRDDSYLYGTHIRPPYHDALSTMPSKVLEDGIRFRFTYISWNMEQLEKAFLLSTDRGWLDLSRWLLKRLSRTQQTDHDRSSLLRRAAQRNDCGNLELVGWLTDTLNCDTDTLSHLIHRLLQRALHRSSTSIADWLLTRYSKVLLPISSKQAGTLYQKCHGIAAMKWLAERIDVSPSKGGLATLISMHLQDLDVLKWAHEQFKFDASGLPDKAFEEACKLGFRDTAEWLKETFSLTIGKTALLFRNCVKRNKLEVAKWLDSVYRFPPSTARSEHLVALKQVCCKVPNPEFAIWLAKRFDLDGDDLRQHKHEVLRETICSTVRGSRSMAKWLRERFHLKLSDAKLAVQGFDGDACSRSQYTASGRLIAGLVEVFELTASETKEVLEGSQLERLTSHVLPLLADDPSLLEDGYVYPM